MADLDLTDAERKLVDAYSLGTTSRAWRLGFYAALIVPSVVFAGYGALRGDVIAMGIGYGGLLLLVLWHIGQELALLPVFSSLMRKVAAQVRAGRGEETAG